MKTAVLRKRLEGIRDSNWGDVPDKIDALLAEIGLGDDNAPRLGCATTRELLAELSARFEVQGAQSGGLDYKTVGPEINGPRTA